MICTVDTDVVVIRIGEFHNNMVDNYPNAELLEQDPLLQHQCKLYSFRKRMIPLSPCISCFYWV